MKQYTDQTKAKEEIEDKLKKVFCVEGCLFTFKNIVRS